MITFKICTMLVLLGQKIRHLCCQFRPSLVRTQQPTQIGAANIVVCIGA